MRADVAAPAAAENPAVVRRYSGVAAGLLLVLLSALLVVAAVALHLRGLRFPLLFDDLDFFQPDSLAYWRGAPASVTRWLPYWTLAQQTAAAGGDLSGLRLVNVLWHGANGVALLLLLRTLIRRFAGAGEALAWAFGGALIFVLHPVAVYATAYLVQRTTLAATFFSLLALWLLALWHRRRAWPLLIGSAICHFLAATSKEHALPLIGCSALLLLWLEAPRVAGWRALWWRPNWLVLPAAAIALVALGLFAPRWTITGSWTLLSPHSEMVGRLYEPIAQRIAESVPTENLFPRSVVTQGYLFFKYLLLWLVPNPAWMSIDMREPVAASVFAWPEFAGFALYLGGGAAAAWLLLRGGRAGLAGFALLFAWTMFVMEFAVVRVQEPFVLYRSYLWMALLPAALPALLSPSRRPWAAALPLLVVPVLFALASQRLNTFSSIHAVWDDAVRENRGRPVYLAGRAYGNRGVALLEQGRVAEAASDFEQALGFHPNDFEALVNSGIAATRLGLFAKAGERLDKAVALKPDFAAAFAHRCVLHLRTGALERAIADCTRAVEIEPRDENSRLNIGAALAMAQRPAEALKAFEALLALNPMRDEALLNRAIVLNRLGRADEARAGLADGCRRGSRAACDALAGRDVKLENR